MPAYDYTCPGLDCGFKQEVQRPCMTNPRADLILCPKCGRLMRREISLPGVVFKGDGWTRSENYLGGENWDIIDGTK